MPQSSSLTRTICCQLLLLLSPSIVSHSLRSHGLQQSRLSCPSLSPSVCLNSCPLSYDAIQPSHPLSPPSSPALNLPSIKIFSIELALCIRRPKYWSFSFSISSSNGYSGLISLRVDWFDLLAVQGTLKSLLQYHRSKASILWCSALFMVQTLRRDRLRC